MSTPVLYKEKKTIFCFQGVNDVKNKSGILFMGNTSIIVKIIGIKRGIRVNKALILTPRCLDTADIELYVMDWM